ncbi:hypothetical protein FIBSPDRAFT_290803 [Athelia psychrophila]|uniref:Uncharacterized protein n=1 Tax=Athelia psychrophila TaxID=1759441 RepID=A0A167XGI0_9AGAM|nr:hypothetical protein FIBSPDRAFT_290803 [Fibularhizoctonia sp. CBS 109695]
MIVAKGYEPNNPSLCIAFAFALLETAQAFHQHAKAPCIIQSCLSSISLAQKRVFAVSSNQVTPAGGVQLETVLHIGSMITLRRISRVRWKTLYSMFSTTQHTTGRASVVACDCR